MGRTYICIDLKSFYASVECVERGLDPLKTDLVVADPTRTEKTICLAVSPSLKAKGVKNRCRVFEIPQGFQYIMAMPRMHLYIEYAADIYEIYMKYIAKEDIHVYSIDEAFMDITDYLAAYKMTPKQLASRIMRDIYETKGITATCGIGTNLYLTKVALDIAAKHVTPDENGARIAWLDEETYQKTLWDHKPLTDFWRVGPGTMARLEKLGITTMGGIAHASEQALYKKFGIDAELLIDHAYGREPVTIKEIKAYKPRTNCLSSGQVLSRDFNYDETRLIVKEMTDSLVLDMVDKGVVTDSIGLYIGYSGDNERFSAHGSCHVGVLTSSSKKILEAIDRLYVQIADKTGGARRINISFNDIMPEECEEYDFFTDPKEAAKEKGMQKALLAIRKKYGNNAVVKGMDLDESATAIERNAQIGGHRA